MPELAHRNVRVVTIDRDPLRAQSWRLISEDEPAPDPAIQPMVADAGMLPVENESVGGIISINLLNAFHENAFPGVKMILEEAYRALKPGGFLILSTFGYSRRIAHDGKVSYNQNIPVPEQITEDALAQLGSTIGFTEIESIPLNHEIKTQMEADWVRAKQTEGMDVKDMSIVSPVGLLLRKPARAENHE
jgi:SAM-dependent methyltransferase